MQLEEPALFLEPQQSGDRPDTSPSGERLTYQASPALQATPATWPDF